MENFNTVPDKGTFGGSVEVINQNFLLAQQEMETLRQAYNSLSQSKAIPVTQLPATGEAGKIYRLAGTTSYSDYMWNGTQFIKMAEYNNAIDDEPVAGSNNLVKSGGVYLKINQEKQRAETSEQNLQESVDSIQESVVSIKEETLEENREMVNSILENYAPIEIHGDVTNAPDEEDLTSVNVGGTDVLKFKDKAYNPITYSGLGRKYLRKNMVNGINTLTQSMISQANTIYVIQYDFTLGEDITVPENCVLEFDGGGISASGSNDIITGNNTSINVKGLYTIFNDVILSGIFKKMDIADSILFNFDTTNGTDESAKFQSLVNIGKEAYVRAGRYFVSNISLSGDIVVTGEDGAILNGVIAIPNYPYCKTILNCTNTNSFCIENVIFEGNVTYPLQDLDIQEQKNLAGSCIECNNVDNVKITKCTFRNHTGNTGGIHNGFRFGQLITLIDCKNTVIEYCDIHDVCSGEHISYYADNLDYDDVSLFFEHNHIAHLITPNSTRYGNSILGEGAIGFISCCYNTVENTLYEGSLLNVFAKRAVINYNHISNCICDAIFDTCEAGMVNNDYVECCGNESNLLWGGLISTSSSVQIIKNNKHIGSLGVALFGYESIESKSEPFNASHFDNGNPIPFEKIAIVDNFFDCTAYSDDPHTTYYNNRYWQGCGVYIDGNSFTPKNVSIRNNTIKASYLKNREGWKEEDVPTLKNVPIYIRDCRTINITGNMVYTNCANRSYHNLGDFVLLNNYSGTVIKNIDISDNEIFYSKASPTMTNGRFGLFVFLSTNPAVIDYVKVINNITHIENGDVSYGWECEVTMNMIKEMELSNVSANTKNYYIEKDVSKYFNAYQLKCSDIINSQLGSIIKSISFDTINGGYYCLQNGPHIKGDVAVGTNDVNGNYKVPNNDLYIRPLQVFSVTQNDLDNYVAPEDVVNAPYGSIIPIFGTYAIKIYQGTLYRIDNG